jgi:hypothetical protein
MPDTTIRIVTLALAGILVWAGLAKFLRWGAWRRALAGYHPPVWAELPAAVVTPLAEIGVAAALLSPVPRVGAALAVALVAGFSLVVLRGRMLEGDKLPCGCFGGASRRDYRTLLVRNSFLGLMAAIILLSQREGSPLGRLSMPDAGELLPALLIGLGVIVALWMVYQVTASARRGQGP